MATTSDDFFGRAAAQLLRALRDRRSQIAVARRLGYSGNPVTDWEHGRRFPTAPEMLRMAQQLGVSLDGAFRLFEPTPAPGGKDWNVAEWLDSLRGSTTTVELARRAGVSRFSVGRWLSGESVPRVHDFLRMLDAISGRAAEWVAAVVPIERVPELEPMFRRTTAARRLSMGLPWSEAVLRVMETRAYISRKHHSALYISRTLGIESTQVTEVILALAEAKVIEPHGHTYRVVGTLVVDTRVEPEVYDRSRRHWARVALERVQTGQETWFAYNVISVSKKDCDRIEQRLRAAFREVRGIVKASDPSEQAALLTIQLLRWVPDEES